MGRTTTEPIVSLGAQVLRQAGELAAFLEARPDLPDPLRRWAEVSLAEVYERLEALLAGLGEAGPAEG